MEGKKLGRPPIPPEQRGKAVWIPFGCMDQVLLIIKQYKQSVKKDQPVI